MAQRRETLQRIIEQLSIGDVHNPPLEVTIHIDGGYAIFSLPRSNIYDNGWHCFA